MADAGQHRRWIRSVVDRFEKPLVRYAAHLLGDVDRGREAAQETFLRLCRADRADVESHLAPWLFTVCRNLAHDVRRKEARMTTLDLETVATTAGPGTDPGEHALRAESCNRLLRALADLPPRQQEVLRLKFGEGLSYREISRVTRLSVSNVGYTIHVAVSRLRATLAADTPQTREVSS